MARLRRTHSDVWIWFLEPWRAALASVPTLCNTATRPGAWPGSCLVSESCRDRVDHRDQVDYCLKLKVDKCSRVFRRQHQSQGQHQRVTTTQRQGRSPALHLMPQARGPSKLSGGHQQEECTGSLTDPWERASRRSAPSSASIESAPPQRIERAKKTQPRHTARYVKPMRPSKPGHVASNTSSLGNAAHATRNHR